MKNHDYKNIVFWVSGAENNKFYGELLNSSDYGPHIKFPKNIQDKFKLKSIDKIIARGENIEYYELINCKYRENQLDYDYDLIFADHILFGRKNLFKNLEKNKVAFEIKNLGKLLTLGTYQTNRLKEKYSFTGVEFKYLYGNNINITSLGNLTIKIVDGLTWNSSIKKDNLSIDSTPKIYISSKSSINFNIFKNEIEIFTKFLSIIFGFNQEIENLQYPLEPIENIFIDSKLNISQNYNSNLEFPLINLIQIKESVENSYTLWNNLLIKNQSTFKLLFYLWEIERIPIEEKFIYWTRIIEAFHRTNWGGYFMEENKYKKYKEKMYSNIPNELSKNFRESLQSRIRYGNEYSLRKRFNEIKNFITIENELFEEKNFNTFIDLTINTRNRFIHNDQLDQKPYFDNNEIKTAIKDLELFFLVAIYLSIHIPKGQIEKSIKFSYLIRTKSGK